MFKTHMAVAFLVGLFGIEHYQPHNHVLFMILVLFGAALVDIDHPHSKIGRRVKYISHLFEHRGFFHSLFALPILAFFIYVITKDFMMAIPLLLGYLSHIVSDSLTVRGIMPFHPLSKWRIRGFFSTGTTSEYALLFILVVVDAYKLWIF